MDWTRPTIEGRLRDHTPKDPSNPLRSTRAAVAAVLRFDGAGARVLLMQRSKRPTDRWSGHVSFPGGREEPTDDTLLHTAIRETHEEVGLDLSRDATLLGRLDGIQAVAKGRVVPMTITPFVFALEQEGDFTLSDEADAVFWLPLAQAAAGELDTVYDWRMGPLRMPLPAWRYEERTVWGLTHQMLMSLVHLIAR